MGAGSNACIACAKSKRKCGRQLPACTRCSTIGRPCVYPPSTDRAASTPRRLLSSAFRNSAPTQENIILAEVLDNVAVPVDNLNIGDDLMLDLTFSSANVESAGPVPLNNRLSAVASKADWFLAPATWKILQRPDTPVTGEYGDAMLRKYVGVLQSWFARWPAEGSNPFIHAHLYRTNFPACVQVAYATMATYVHRTTANTGTVLRIVEERAKDLLRDNGAVLDRIGANDWIDDSQEDVDLFAQIARLHALAFYQDIGLFDGDVRARHVAEGRMAVLRNWAHKLIKSAAEPLAIDNAVAAHIISTLPRQTTPLQRQWKLWILSESIRRTWLVAASLPSVYLALQQRWAVCPGGIMYTNRRGLWDAPSSIEWEKQCLEKGTAFLHRFEGSRLFNESQPADVDEFGIAILDMTFDRESLEVWRGGNALPI
jgi:hypothetical protein